MPVVYISSDEEEETPKITDLDWIKDFLLTSDEESDDSDVVVVSESKPKLKSKSLVKDVAVKKDGYGDGDDDDCVVLEGDPENGVTSVEEEATGSDELLVVGEKGQIACRDYPHARHLCAKFPFSSTPHERYCAQCHCYVCDSLAPCLKWGTGILSSDHCHANDKTEVWKIQRQNLKLGPSSPLAASTISATSLSVVHSQRNANLPRHIQLPPYSVIQNQASTRSTALHTHTSLNSSLNSISKNQALQPTATYARSPPLISGVQNLVSRPVSVPVCRPATNLTIPIGANHGRCPESGSTLVRDRTRLCSVSPRQFLGVRSHAIQRERVRNASSLGPQYLRPHVMSKGIVGSTGNTLTANHSSRVSSGFNNHVNAVQQPENLHTASGFPIIRNSNGSGDVSHPINLPLFQHSSPRPVCPGLVSLSHVNQHAVTSETQVYGQSLPQSNATQNFHQKFIPGNGDPYMACLNPPQHGIELPIISQNGNANGHNTETGITSQDTCQPEPHEEGPTNVTAERLPVFKSSWTENTSQNVEPVVACSPLQSSGSINQLPNVKVSSTQATGDIESHIPSTQVTGNTEPLNERSQLPSSIVDIENWLLNQDSNALATDGFLSFDFELNIPSPDLSPIGSGALLSSWWDTDTS